MGVGGWVQVSLEKKKLLEKRPKIALYQYRYFGVMYHVYAVYVTILD